MKINIETKFDVGQEVYFCECFPVPTNKEPRKSEKFYYVKSEKIRDIEITKNEGEIYLTYHIGLYGDITEEELFSTKQIAQKRCNELNKERGWTDEQIKELMEDQTR